MSPGLVKTVSPKVRAFLDFIREGFGSPPYWEAAVVEAGLGPKA